MSKTVPKQHSASHGFPMLEYPSPTLWYPYLFIPRKNWKSKLWLFSIMNLWLSFLIILKLTPISLFLFFFFFFFFLLSVIPDTLFSWNYFFFIKLIFQLWDIRQLKPIQVMKSHTEKVTACRFFKDTDGVIRFVSISLQWSLQWVPWQFYFSKILYAPIRRVFGFRFIIAKSHFKFVIFWHEQLHWSSKNRFS